LDLTSISRKLLFLVLALSVLSGAAGGAQPRAMSPTAFRATVLNIQKQTVEWERLVETLNLEELPIGYAEGKVIDQQISILKNNIHYEARLCGAVLEKDSLADEIRLMAVLADISRGFEELSNELTGLTQPTSTSSEQKVGSLALKFETLGGQQINDEYIQVYGYVLSHADTIESRNGQK
jgi:hypothetical protein